MKKLNSFNHQGNTNQNDIDIPTHPNQNDYHPENQKQQMLVRMQVESPYALWLN
jgi:hypothetical protein